MVARGMKTVLFFEPSRVLSPPIAARGAPLKIQHSAPQSLIFY
jgi:hypothetical protein